MVNVNTSYRAAFNAYIDIFKFNILKMDVLYKNFKYIHVLSYSTDTPFAIPIILNYNPKNTFALALLSPPRIPGREINGIASKSPLREFD